MPLTRSRISCWFPAYIGLGANLGDRKATLDAAVRDLSTLETTRLVCRSALYESPPMGPSDQPDYLNGVAGLITRLAPRSLLVALQSIEHRHGRRRDGQRWGPRTLDLDLLVYVDHVLDEADLSIPHPGVSSRAFVLAPLADIAPSLNVPGAGRVETLLRAVDTGSLRRYTA